jgi:hypothetical protein
MTDHHGLNELKDTQVMCHYGHQAQPGNRFGRMFNLPPLYTDPAALERLGQQKDGPMKAEEKLPTTTVPVGQVFFGQFVDHDITLDTTSSLEAVAEPEETPNVRTPTLDLDCVYGLGPEAHPYLFEGQGKPFQGVKLLTGTDDLSRSADGTAIIGDHRNDENRIISQLQLAMIRFHNNVVDYVVADKGLDPKTIDSDERKALYKDARELVTWHYQWVVINDFLVKMCGQAVVADILGHGRRFYCVHGETPFIPIEFSAAAYRFGHSMIPQRLKIRQDGVEHDLFGEVLGTGFKPVSGPEAIVEWPQLVDTGQTYPVQMADQLDSKLAEILLALPFITEGEKSLATRNLLRGQTFLLPSGESVASAMEQPAAEINDVSQKAQELAGENVDLSNGTPLWFYILVEAATIGRAGTNQSDKGEGLGPIGARIVAETLIGLVELDPRSYLGKNRNWTPKDGVGVATLGQMLTYPPG